MALPREAWLDSTPGSEASGCRISCASTLGRRSRSRSSAGRSLRQHTEDALEVALNDRRMCRYLKMDPQTTQSSRLEEGLAINFLYDMGTHISKVRSSATPEWSNCHNSMAREREVWSLFEFRISHGDGVTTWCNDPR